MFVAVYRWRLKPGSEEAFAAAWRDVTLAAQPYGSGGSALFKADDGTWAAIARWPDRKSRTQFFEARSQDHDDSAMWDAVAERFPPLELQMVDDLWKPIGGAV